ncbi:Protein spaetzle 3 [Amphibalanus amphitrite]|uniref:Protein spaetzle 3 n=1 Tax=Amphibalanus amphitrite TaxID=1232801 RepID=A0A6A4WG49_AMPAM|nr:Protein spaetzle 3 [Amphibalanus amphitrite]
MAGSAVQYSQLGDFASSAGQYQPYPYNNPAFANDQYPSASLPQAQVHNFIQSPPAAPPRGQTANQPRFGERTVARPSGRRRKQQPAQRGPIVTKDGGDSVVPLYSYQTLKNNTVVQVPIFWTALNIALGYQVQADQVIRGLPCIKRLRQLFCTNAGSQYPTDRIESFINENKALTRRMFGTFPPPPPDLGNEVSTLPEMEPFETVDFTTEPYPLDTGFTGEGLTALEAADLPLTGPSGTTGGSRGELRRPFPRAKRSADNDTMSAVVAELNRQRRQAVPSPPVIDKGSKHLVDSCESKVEIVTPYWAANSAGEIRAIVNTKHFPQAIHQEICKGTTTSRCTGNCLCEQKYTYHRLLSYDPDNDCKGIFIDWFLFPSCCACRCPP